MYKTVEAAMQRIIDRITMYSNGESAAIDPLMFQYKVLRDLPDPEYEAVYEEIARACFGK